MLVAASGCERPHDSAADLAEIVAAIRQADAQKAFELHVDSTGFSTWCDQSFRTILTRAQKSRNAEECARIEGMTGSDLDLVPDEVRFALQVTRFACAHPEADCRDYARETFLAVADDSPLFQSEPRKVEVQRHFGDDHGAAAYLTVTLADGETVSRVLELKKAGSRWRVAEGLFP